MVTITLQHKCTDADGVDQYFSTWPIGNWFITVDDSLFGFIYKFNFHADSFKDYNPN